MNESEFSIPSETLPQNVGEQAFLDTEGELRWILRRLKRQQSGLPEDEPGPLIGTSDGPHGKALQDFLDHFVSRPGERVIWPRYYQFCQVRESDLPHIETASRQAGLEYWEYVCMVTLAELQRFARSEGIVTSVPPVRPPYLGIVLGSKQDVTRILGDVLLGPVEFRDAMDQWDLLSLLVSAGDGGITREQVDEITDWSDKLKGRLNTSIMEPLRLEVKANRKGVWKLTTLPPP